MKQTNSYKCDRDPVWMNLIRFMKLVWEFRHFLLVAFSCSLLPDGHLSGGGGEVSDGHLAGGGGEVILVSIGMISDDVSFGFGVHETKGISVGLVSSGVKAIVAFHGLLLLVGLLVALVGFLVAGLRLVLMPLVNRETTALEMVATVSVGVRVVYVVPVSHLVEDSHRLVSDPVDSAEK